MATKDRDRFEHAERSDRLDLSPLDPNARKEKISRKRRFTPLLTVGLSAIAGTTVGYLLFSDPPRRFVPQQQLASAPPLVAELPDASVDPVDTSIDDVKRSPRQGSGRDSRTFDRVVVAGPTRSSAPAMPPAPAYDSPPERSRTSKEKTEKQPKESAEPEFRWPSTQLYHLYRKRDKLHYYTTSAQTFGAYQESEGFKPRLAPGYVYTENAYPKKLREIHPYGLNEPIYVFMRDQGDETVPLYRLRNFGGNKDMYTSWDHIRQEWIDKGWADEGIAGYIYRA